MSGNFARTLSAAVEYLNGTHEKFTDSSGKYWGNAGAGILFIAEDTGRFLLQHRSKYVTEPGSWGVCGGALDPGEDPATAALREAKEETGYTGPTSSPEQLYKFQDNKFVYTTFAVWVPHEFEPSKDAKDAWEAQGYGWYTFDTLPSPLHFGVKPLLSPLKDLLANP
jgi:8-oxo-dGTP pyrophosphatase MutT (NUDIX family)